MGVEATSGEIVTAFQVDRPRETVFAFLATPRNHFTANRAGPIVEQSDGPLRTGSCYVLAFDQLRAASPSRWSNRRIGSSLRSR